MKSTLKSKPKSASPSKVRRALSGEEFDAKFDAGEDITSFLDPDSAVVFEAGEERLDLTPTKVNVDFPRWLADQLNAEADKIGIPRQSLIKMWLSDRLKLERRMS